MRTSRKEKNPVILSAAGEHLQDNVKFAFFFFLGAMVITILSVRFPNGSPLAHLQEIRRCLRPVRLPLSTVNNRFEAPPVVSTGNDCKSQILSWLDVAGAARWDIGYPDVNHSLRAGRVWNCPRCCSFSPMWWLEIGIWRNLDVWDSSSESILTFLVLNGSINDSFWVL